MKTLFCLFTLALLTVTTLSSAQQLPNTTAVAATPDIAEVGAAKVNEGTIQSQQKTSAGSVVIDASTQQAELNLLGNVVAPGSTKIVNWEFENTFLDTSAPVPVLVVNGVNTGPTLCLTAAVHGDELNGIEIVRRIVHDLKPEKLSGAVIGVPIVNLQGFLRANRYLPDRRDLNRYFPGRSQGSYASRIAHSFFSEIVTHCDYLIDLHTGSLSRTNLPQLRANLSDPQVAQLAEQMGSIVVLHSLGGAGTLRRAASEAGIPAVTLEAGAPNNLQKEAVEQGIKTISAALRSLGLTSKPRWTRSEEPVFFRAKWVRAHTGGILFSKVELGDNVEKDSVLGLLSNPITNKTTKIRSPIDGLVIGMALNQVMYPGFAAYHIGLKSSIVEAAKPGTPEPEEELDTALVPQSEDKNKLLDDVFSTDKAAESSSVIEDMVLPTIDDEG